MRESTKSTVTMVATVASPAASLASTFAASQVEPGFATAMLALASCVAGVVFGWCLRFWRELKSLTPHERLCRRVLAELSERGDGATGWLDRQLEHEKVDGRTDFGNALRSLVEQGCVRDLEIVDYSGGNTLFYPGAHFGVTGKRYVND